MTFISWATVVLQGVHPQAIDRDWARPVTGVYLSNRSLPIESLLDPTSGLCVHALKSDNGNKESFPDLKEKDLFLNREYKRLVGTFPFDDRTCLVGRRFQLAPDQFFKGINVKFFSLKNFVLSPYPTVYRGYSQQCDVFFDALV